MIGVLGGAVYLVKQNQETRRGATQAETSSSILPSEITGVVGTEFKVTLMVNTGQITDEMSAGELEIEYDRTKLEYLGIALTEPFTLAKPTVDSGSGTLKVNYVSITENKGGAFQLAQIRFKPLVNGESNIKANGMILIQVPALAKWDLATNNFATVKVGAMVTGDPPTGTAMECDWCGTNCVNKANYTGECAPNPIDGKVCVAEAGDCVIKTVSLTPGVVACADYNGELSCNGNSSCKWWACSDKCFDASVDLATACVVTNTFCNSFDVKDACNLRNTKSDAKPGGCAWYACGTGEKCWTRGTEMANVPGCETTSVSPTAGITVAPTAEPTIEPTAIPTSIPAGKEKIAFKTQMRGVSSSSKCGLNEKLKVVVRYEDGTLEEFKDVPIVNGVSTIVANIGKNIALFIKGPQHLQMKYGQDGQNSRYPSPGGVIETSGTKVYDFTGYQMLPGDVNGDGWINGLDFSAVKNKAVKYVDVAEGGYIVGDLDGSCQVNTRDLTLLVNSLDEKQEELY